MSLIAPLASFPSSAAAGVAVEPDFCVPGLRAVLRPEDDLRGVRLRLRRQLRPPPPQLLQAAQDKAARLQAGPVQAGQGVHAAHQSRLQEEHLVVNKDEREM